MEWLIGGLGAAIVFVWGLFTNARMKKEHAEQERDRKAREVELAREIAEGQQDARQRAAEEEATNASRPDDERPSGALPRRMRGERPRT